MKPHKTMSNHFFTCAAVAALSLSVSAAADAMGDGNGNSQGSSAVITTEIDFNDNCSVTVTSTKELSNIVIESTDGSVRFDDLSGHQYTISGEDLLNAVNVYVKSGNNGTRGKRNRGLGEPLDTDEFRASEIANDGIDQNCNGSDLTTFFADIDGDGFGDLNNTMNFEVEIAPPGFVSDATDCDDMRADINPDGTDSNGEDRNCDGTVDPAVVFALAYTELDGEAGFTDGDTLIARWVDGGEPGRGPGDLITFGEIPTRFLAPFQAQQLSFNAAIVEDIRPTTNPTQQQLIIFSVEGVTDEFLLTLRADGNAQTLIIDTAEGDTDNDARRFLVLLDNQTNSPELPNCSFPDIIRSLAERRSPSNPFVRVVTGLDEIDIRQTNCMDDNFLNVELFDPAI